VGELDGVWNVKRVSGVLPPMVGVQKRISGSSGETRIGPFLGVPFAVVGRDLHYHVPFRGFVDRLEPDGTRWLGRATFRGRAFGRFALEREESPTQILP
jgi:hypothetical protein